MDQGPHRTGRLNYLARSVEPALYRNGRVRTRRDESGSDAGTEGLEIERRDIGVEDARALERDAPCTLVRSGFERLGRPLARPDLDFLQHEPVVRRYYPECEEIVREATGAPHVFAFDHNVRSAKATLRGTRIAGGQRVQAPAHIVHGDYTLTSAPQRLRDLAAPASGNDTLRPFLAEGASLIPPALAERALAPGGRFAIINVWRNIAAEPVVTHPLAFCDAQTVAPADLVVFEIHYADRIGENYFARHSRDHRWYGYPELRRDEVVLIKQWDAAGPLARSQGAHPDSSAPSEPCTFSFHTAFHDRATPPDAPDRFSIEVRCAVLHD